MYFSCEDQRAHVVIVSFTPESGRGPCGIYHPDLIAENIAPDGGPGGDII